MATWVVIALLATALLFPACSAGEAETATRPDTPSQAAISEPEQSPVEQAIEIAKEVQADPDRAPEILQQFGLTEEEFDQLLYDIAADPELRKIYNEAVGR